MLRKNHSRILESIASGWSPFSLKLKPQLANEVVDAHFSVPTLAEMKEGHRAQEDEQTRPEYPQKASLRRLQSEEEAGNILPTVDRNALSKPVLRVWEIIDIVFNAALTFGKSCSHICTAQAVFATSAARS
jgi:hypothetical protein